MDALARAVVRATRGVRANGEGARLVATRAIGAPPRRRTLEGLGAATRAPGRAARRRKSKSRGGSDDAFDDGDDGGFGGFGGFGGGGGGGDGEGSGADGDDDEDEDAFEFKMNLDELLDFERKVLADAAVIDAHALYAWQSACAVTLVGCVQHVIDTAVERVRAGGTLTFA